MEVNVLAYKMEADGRVKSRTKARCQVGGHGELLSGCPAGQPPAAEN